MPRHHTQHMQNVGPNLFVHNENSAYIMPHVTAHAVMCHDVLLACEHLATVVFVFRFALCVHIHVLGLHS